MPSVLSVRPCPYKEFGSLQNARMVGRWRCSRAGHKPGIVITNRCPQGRSQYPLSYQGDSRSLMPHLSSLALPSGLCCTWVRYLQLFRPCIRARRHSLTVHRWSTASPWLSCPSCALSGGTSRSRSPCRDFRNSEEDQRDSWSRRW